jgi:hypothetical protein
MFHLFLALFFSFQINAHVGFYCPKLDIVIERADIGVHHTLIIRSTTERNSFEFNPRIDLSPESSPESNLERLNLYAQIIQTTPLHYGYMPEFLLVFRSMKGQKLFRQGFKVMEEGGAPVELNPTFCKVLKKTILAY